MGITNDDTSPSQLLQLPSSLRVISLNCWGLKYISKFRHERLTEIGHQLAQASPAPEIVGLQECWTQQDFLKIHDLTKHILPHGKFYWSGVFGGGLAILSKWPIEESSMFRYPLNGRPAAFWRGDWYVGKGVASARIRIGNGGGGEKDVVEVFCTHLHAPYEQEPNDSYLCHRTAQAWEIAKMMRHAAERGHIVLGLGDFNMLPLSLAHRIIEGHAPVRDIWRLLYPDSALGSAENAAERARNLPVPTAKACLAEHGATCDSKFNTWRWSKQMQKDLHAGRDSTIDPEDLDPKAKRLDYIFFADNGSGWRVESAQVGMTMRHPTLRCSLSDHFSIETTLVRTAASSPPEEEEQQQQQPPTTRPMIQPLDPANYSLIQQMIKSYDARQRRQRSLQLAHFWLSLAISIGCLIAVWWSPHNYVAFILMLLSTLNLSAGVLDGLMGFLFVKTELRALKEFKFEIDQAARRGDVITASEDREQKRGGDVTRREETGVDG
ncbi:probable sphingomyelinase family [Lecanosticta acicola]|uniref:Probable sphingomyelinase family n=1 Tax=Lecanosticta acicola TaxID=111012 RepID=A0AAI8YV54_9PEZI|nr:probable sphingomyelinase family [Lecanosticta acicola]